MAYTFLQAAIEVLWDSPTPLKVFDIWDKILQKGLDKKIGSTGLHRSIRLLHNFTQV